MKKILPLLISGTFIFSSANAGSISVANSDIEMTGGITAAYFYMTNIGEEPNDQFTVTNFDFDLSSNINSVISFEAGIGSAHLPDLMSPIGESDFEVEFAWVDIELSEDSNVSAGKLLTNVGYELFDTFNNPNYHYGLVWWGQPVHYPGVRLTYNIDEDVQFYAEYNHDSSGSIKGIKPEDAIAAGIIGSLGSLNIAVNYFDYMGTKNLLDLVLTTHIADFDVALNIDYQWLDDGAKAKIKDAGSVDTEDKAYGIAFYLTTHVSDTVSVPVRIEYVYDGESKDGAGNTVDKGIYGISGDNAWSFTITPTWHPLKNTYVRGEFAYVVMDKKGFENDKGEEKDNRSFFGVELGFIF